MLHSNQPASPPAARLRRPRWSDPRLLIGVFIVAGSVVAGARVMAAADDTVAVWSIDGDHRAGTPVDRDDLRSVDVHLGSANAQRYVPADESIASGRVWARDVHEGELLGTEATMPPGASAVGELPVIVAPGALPADLTRGDRVAVWVSETRASGRGKARLALDDMRVLSVSQAPVAMGGDNGHRVLLALEHDKPNRLGAALGSISTGKVTLVRRVEDAS
ncbi:MAG TPA: hypothetical protein VK059_06800 [Nocardioidaceae bacterium]|nr:hypothetical protein [Nocardioidaceae bacterium]